MLSGMYFAFDLNLMLSRTGLFIFSSLAGAAVPAVGLADSFRAV